MSTPGTAPIVVLVGLFRITCGACGVTHEVWSQAELRASQLVHTGEHESSVEFEVERVASEGRRQTG